VQERAAKRGPGRPRKIPLAKMDDVTSDFSLELNPPASVPAAVPAQPALDTETLRALVEGLTDGVEDIACGIARAQIRLAGGDKQLRDEIAAECKISEKTRAMIVLGGTELAKKYVENLQYAPEIMVLGGLAIYSVGVAGAIRAGKDKLTEFRKAQE
ncbi:MAG: hypothetical protein L0Z53_21550, partial [Acidobacteriales bacterium]|nr:hypothetical protein [Terriglobales bacterium]